MDEREIQIKDMMEAGAKAQRERLDDPKNKSKGLFSEDFWEAVNFVDEEYNELDFETRMISLNFTRIREEAADLKNYLDNLILICDKKLRKQ